MSMTNTIEGAVSMSIYTLLKGEHDEVSVLMSMLDTAPDVMNTAKLSLFEKLKNELLSHAHAEESMVYPHVRARLKEKNEVDHARYEHKEIEGHLTALERVDIHSAEWNSHLARLKAAVDHHVHEEEDSLFEKMKSVFSDEEAEGLAKAFHRAKQAELERLRSASPELSP